MSHQYSSSSSTQRTTQPADAINLEPTLRAMHAAGLALQSLKTGIDQDMGQFRRHMDSAKFRMTQLKSSIEAEKRKVQQVDASLRAAAARLELLGGSHLTREDVMEMCAVAKAVKEMGGVNSIAIKLAARKRKRAERASRAGKTGKEAYADLLYELDLDPAKPYRMHWEGGSYSMVTVCDADAAGNVAADAIVVKIGIKLQPGEPDRFVCLHAASASSLLEVCIKNAPEVLASIVNPSNISILYTVDYDAFSKVRNYLYCSQSEYASVVETETKKFIRHHLGDEALTGGTSGKAGPCPGIAAAAKMAVEEGECVCVGEDTVEDRNRRGFANAIDLDVD